MITHRMATQSAPEPPVRFYKIIAISFLVLTVGLFGVIVFMTSKKAEVVVLAKEDSEDIKLTALVNAVSASTTKTMLAGTVTSTVFFWQNDYHPTGDKKVPAVATGEVTLHNTTASPQPLVKTTRLLSSGGILMRLKDAVTVPAGGTITARVYADAAGASGNIAPTSFTIPGLPAAKQKQVYAESTKPMEGGEREAGVLSSDDITNAESNYKQKVVEAYTQLHPTPSSDGVLQTIVAVSETRTNVDHGIGDEVTTFTVSGTSTVLSITFKNDDVNDLLNKALEERVDVSAEKLLSADKKPTITFKNYNARTGIAELEIYEPVLVTLDANSTKLSPHNFVGKSKEEIERAVMSIDHVSGAQVKFSPSWMSTAPSSADRIKVLVKNVQ